MTRRRRLVASLLALALSLAACSRDEIPFDAWMNPPGESMWPARGPRAQDRPCHPVVAAALPGVLHRLERTPCIAVTNAEAAALVGHAVTVTPGRSLYLLRGLMMHELTGGFGVSELSKRVLVSHVSLGPLIPMTRAAVVAELDSSPKVVFVSAGSAL